MMYGNQWHNYCYPPLLGADKPTDSRWPVFVFKPAVYAPTGHVLPRDDPDPAAEHSYILTTTFSNTASSSAAGRRMACPAVI